MNDFQRDRAVSLLRECARDARCKSIPLLDKLRQDTARDGGPSYAISDLATSQDKREMLPSYAKVQRCIERNRRLLDCGCRLCQPPDCVNRSGSLAEQLYGVNIYKPEKLQDLVTLILCGCLFVFRESEVLREKSLVEYLYDHRSDTGRHTRLFSRLGPTVLPEQCSHYIDGPMGAERRDIDFAKNVCNTCRWAIFQDAFDLKKSVADIRFFTMDWEMPEDIENMSKKNLPFIYEDEQLINSERGNPKFYVCKMDKNFCQPEQLEDIATFRKVYHYQLHDAEYGIKHAKAEARIAYNMSRRHKNIAWLRFAFKYESSDHEFVELVYPQYDTNLGELLSRSSTQTPTLGSEHKHELVDEPLWKAMLEIVSAVAEMHRAIEDRAITCSGHMDIKPANILANENNDGTQSLYLTDFGHAAHTSFRNATSAYAPPRPESGVTSSFKTSYDTWSLACVLLQVLVFIKRGKAGLESFDSRRREQHADAAFWTKLNTGTFVLRKTVDDTLKKFEAEEFPRTTGVVGQIRAMLNTNPNDRPKIGLCLDLFKSLEHEKNPDNQDLIMCGSEKWKVEFASASLMRKYPVEITIYRDSRHRFWDLQRNSRAELITIDLSERNGKELRSTYPCRLELIMPHAFFSSQDDSTQQQFVCRFKMLHRDHKFYFSNKTEYLRFLEVITCQHILPNITDKGTRGATEFPISSCKIKEKGKILSELVAENRCFNGGNLQIWKELSDAKYDELYKRMPSSVSHKNMSNTTRTKYQDRRKVHGWKIMLWTLEASTKDRVCVLLDIGKKEWALDYKHQNEQKRRIRVVRKGFFGKILGWVFKPESPAHATQDLQYPGIPIDPDQLDKFEGRLEFTQVSIDLINEEDRDILVNILKREGFKI